jgi:hypothetical protein
MTDLVDELVKELVLWYQAEKASPGYILPDDPSLLSSASIHLCLMRQYLSDNNFPADYEKRYIELKVAFEKVLRYRGEKLLAGASLIHDNV